MIEHLLGESLPDDEIEEWLRRSGYRDVKRAADGAKLNPAITVTPPAYRDDILHPVDIIEDLAIARGYNAFAPILPEEFTVGRLSREERLAKRVSELMIGAGYQEVMSNILTSRELLLERMNRPADDDASLVEIENVMSGNYAVLRDSVVPSLLAVEAVSSKALYPHRTFEVGECAVVDSNEILGTRTLLILGALLAHPAATFSELHSTLDALLFYLGGQASEATLEPFDHPACLAGRAGRIRIAERDVGWIGELNPECLERWGIAVPASAFELDLGTLLTRL
jgi:phenylalanyl-tRNA synthetase beta chain